VKRQSETRTAGSLYASLVSAVLSFIEDNVEEEGQLWGSKVPAYLLSPSDALRELERRPSIELVIPGSRASEELSIAGKSLRLLSGQLSSDHVGVERLYLAAPRSVLRLDRHLLARYAQETTETGVEFMFIYANTGDLLVLEGERYRVSIPRVRASMIFHTHPEGACGLSGKDIESALDLLTEGGLASGSVTKSCAALVYRVGVVNEDEYLSFKSGKVASYRTLRIETIWL